MYLYLRIAFPNQASPTSIHHSMFIPTLKGQGTDEQVKKWLLLAENYQIIGTYVQTELGHGTYILLCLKNSFAVLLLFSVMCLLKIKHTAIWDI